MRTTVTFLRRKKLSMRLMVPHPWVSPSLSPGLLHPAVHRCRCWYRQYGTVVDVPGVYRVVYIPEWCIPTYPGWCIYQGSVPSYIPRVVYIPGWCTPPLTLGTMVGMLVYPPLTLGTMGGMLGVLYPTLGTMGGMLGVLYPSPKDHGRHAGCYISP